MLVKYCTIVHPYNLADNRHLVFYAWKLMYKFRLALVPVYSISIFLVWETLPKSFFFQLTFWLCSFIVLVPQKLFEFRYFMVPFLIYDIFSTTKKSYLSILFNIVINIFVMYIFATKEIRWEDEEKIQRMFW